MNAKKTGKSYLKPILIGAAIFTVLIAHFAVSQFIAFKSENDSSVTELIEKHPVTFTAPIAENKPAEIVAEAKVASTVERRKEPKIESKRTVEQETTSRKPAARETKAERLRRVERILTGI